jgi:colanic acid biosynthesis glycosyl transferase WcaI
VRVLIIALHYAPDQVSGGFDTTYLAEGLSALGHRVTVVTAFPFHRHHRIEPEYGGRLWQAETRNGVRVIRTWLYLGGRKDQVGGRFASYATFSAITGLAAVATGRHDVVVTPSPPLTNGLTAFLYGRLFGVPYVYNVRDIYPDVAVQLGVIRGARAIRFFHGMERFVYRHAARVVVLTDGMQRNLASKGFAGPKVSVIPHAVDTEAIRPLPKENDYARRHGLEDRFVAMYAGNMGLAQGMETALDAADLLRREPITLALVGDGAARGTMVAEIARRGLKNVTLLPFVPRDEVAEMHAAADVGLSLLRRGVAAHAMPAKIYSIMASGRPVIATAEADTPAATLVTDAGCGVVVPPEDPEALATALRSLASDGDARRRMGERGREYVVRHYSRGAVAEQYERLLRDVVGRRA